MRPQPVHMQKRTKRSIILWGHAHGEGVKIAGDSVPAEAPDRKVDGLHINPVICQQHIPRFFICNATGRPLMHRHDVACRWSMMRQAKAPAAAFINIAVAVRSCVYAAQVFRMFIQKLD